MNRLPATLLLLVLLSTGCSESSTGENIQSGGQPLSSAVSSSASAAPSAAGPSSSASAASSDTPASNDAKVEFVERVRASEDESLLQELTGDLDADGADEHVFAIGNEWGITQVHVVRPENGTMATLGGNLAGGGYGVDEVKLVALEDSPKKYIYLGLTNGGGLKGFQLFELVGGVPRELVYSASATGSGEDLLLDRDEDGQFDGYEQNRSAYDVLYYGVQRTFEWEKNGFAFSGAKVELPGMPANTAEEAARHYLQLRVLDSVPENRSPEVADRLGLLRLSGELTPVELDPAIWWFPVEQDVLGIGENLTMEVLYEEEMADVTFTVDQDGSKQQFVLEMVNRDGLWKVSAEQLISADKN